MTQSGRVFTWGNNYYGLVGNGEFGRDENNIDIVQQTPYELTSAFNLVDDKIIDVEFGSRKGFALSEEGRIFSWGWEFSSGYSMNELTNQLTLNEGEFVIRMNVKNTTSVFYTNQQRSFGLGPNAYGIFGEGTPILETITLIENNFFLNVGETVENLQLGTFGATLLTNQRIFKSGTNFRGAIGYDDSINATSTSSEPNFVDITSYLELTENEHVISHALADYSTLVLTSNNRVLTWGNNYYGLLGNNTGPNDHAYKPIDVTDFFELKEGEVFVDAKSDRDAYIIMTNQRLFMLGNNQYRIGLGSTDLSVRKPLDITPAFKLAPGEFPTMINSQGHTYMSFGMITNHNNVFMWGHYGEYRMLYYVEGVNPNAMYVTEPVLIQDYFDEYQPPIYNGNASFEYEASDQAIDWQTLIETNVSDNDAQNITVSVLETPVMNEVGTQEVLFSLEDDSGNVRVDTIEVVIVDTTAPVLTSAVESINVPSGTEIDYQLTATDNAAGEIEIIFITPSFSNESIGTRTVRMQAKDASGNLSDEVAIVVTIYDATPPIITLEGETEITLEVGTNYEEPGALVDDNHSDNLVATISGDVVDSNIVGIYVITYDAVDGAGNEATQVTRTVNIVDTTAPVITLTGDAEVTLEAGATYTELGATFTDNYDQDGNATVGGDTVDTSILGTYVVTYDVTDANGNAATQVSRTVNVVDTTAPVITLTGDAEITLEVGSTYNELGATFTDNYDQDGNAIVGGDSVDTNTLGTYTVNYNVTDSEGNVATQVTRTVNVVDTTAPVITLTGDAEITLEVGSTYNELGATFTDNYDQDGNATVGGDSVDTNTLGSYTITYDVTDVNGNAATQVTRIVNVVDTTAPVITLVGDAEITLSVGEIYEELGATATDNYDTNLNVVIAGDAVDTETEGTYVVTYNVTDNEGNVATQVTRTIIVESTSNPIIAIVIGVLSVSAVSAGGAFLYIKKIKPSLKK